MRLLILLLVAIALVILAVQNQAPVVLVFFGSSAALSLPLAGWILLFTAAGMLTSFVIQFLNYLQRGSAPPKRAYRSVPPVDPEPPPQREAFENPVDEPKTAVSDWEQPESEDWAEEPRRSTLEEFERRLPNEPVDEQQPQSASQSGSVYSSGYKPLRKSEVETPKPSSKTETSPKDNQSDQVYDANYRIITPPYRNEPTEEPEDEDWV